MCGLAGILSYHAPAAWERMRGALQRIRHRGPDGEGIMGIGFDEEPITADTADARLILGFRRLSILDLSHDADQPMRCPHTGNLIVFNGEIYNFLELRAALEQLGHRFTTQGDTEVILASYRQWGEAAFARFNGMWAMAIYDAATGEVILSRDRMGVKPLYLAQTPGQLVFASELRAVIHLLGAMPALHDAAVFDFLAGIDIDHDEHTLHAGITALPPGELWRVARDGAITRTPYHQWPTAIAEHSPDDLRALFTDAVALRLRSDAPTVSLLSGGLDSSITTWVAAQYRHAPRSRFIGAYSYGYDDPRYAEHDEIARARALMAALPEPLAHTVLQMNPVPTLDELLAMTAAQELPSTTPSIIASWRLYRHMAQQGIKVAISGEGADELFAGYTKLHMPLRARDCLRQGRLGALATLLASPYLTSTALLNRMAWDLPAALLKPLLRRMRPNISTLNAAFWSAQHARFDRIIDRQREGLEARLRRDIIHTGMPPLLRYADRNSMAAGVEVRLPFMDYRLVEMALSTPVDAKLNAAGGKQLLRRAFAGVLPDSILAQPKTHGFGHAEQYQVLQLPLAPLLERAPTQAWDYMDRHALEKQLAQPSAHPMVWLPVSFLLWMTVRHEQRL